MFNRASTGQSLPKRVSTAHDPLFRFHRWLANLRVREIEEIKSIPYAPVSHPFVERLIGTVRREYLDRVFFWNSVDLMRKLDAFRDYYNAHRVHRALAGSTPAQRTGAPPAPATLAGCAWQQHCRGLFSDPNRRPIINSPPTGSQRESRWTSARTRRPASARPRLLGQSLAPAAAFVHHARVSPRLQASHAKSAAARIIADHNCRGLFQTPIPA